MQALWSKTLPVIEKEIMPVPFEMHIKELIPVSNNNNIFVLKAKSDFSKNTIEKRYYNDILNSLQSVLGENIELKIITDDEPIAQEHQNLINKYVFEKFVKGDGNEFAYTACLAIAENPGANSAFNPLYLYGGVGLGKTHLMHSIGNYIAKNKPNLKILYVSSETFTNDLITSLRETKLREDKMKEFRNKYRDVDVLLIDDVQFFSEKESTQEELFHTFNALYDNCKQIVFTSDKPPKDIKSLEGRLSSRLGWGLLAELNLPSYETRIAILEKKTELNHFYLSNNVINYLAKNIYSNIRDLEAALNKIMAYSKLTNSSVDLALAETILKDIVHSQKNEINVHYIQETVANYYKLTVDDLLSKKKTQNITRPRHVAIYLTRKLLDLSMPVTGQAFGGRDHATVIHACNKINSEIESDANFAKIVNDLEHKILGF